METKKQESRPDQPFSFFYERKGTEKDAVALIPVLRGAIRLHNSSVLSLMHPLIRLQTPETDIRSQSWKLHVARPLAKVHGAMRLCKIPFFHTISAPTNYMQKYSAGGAAQPVKASVPFPKVFAQINEIENQLITSLSNSSTVTVIIGNAVELRKQALLELAVHLSIANEGGNVVLKDQLYAKMQAAWTKSTKTLMSLPFKRKYAHRGMEDWSGLKNFDSFWDSLLQSDKEKKFAEFSSDIFEQERDKLTTVIASMKLSNNYYTELATILQKEDLVDTMMKQLINDNILKTADISSDKLSFSTIEKWEEYVGQFFSDMLTERFEIFQSHAYTYFSLLTGRGKHALKKAAQLTEKVIETTCGNFFESNVDLYISQGETPQAAAQRLLIAKCRNQFIIAQRNLPIDINAFFKQVAIKPITDEDKLAFRTKVKAMFSGLPDQTKFVRNGELYDTCLPSVNSHVETVWTRTMAWNMEELPIGKGSPTLKLHHRAHRGSEFLQQFFNTELKGDVNKNISFLVSAAIIHANGIHENAFAAVLCNNDALAENGKHYLKKYKFPMQNKAIDALTGAIPPGLQTPSWVQAPTIEHITAQAPYCKDISSLFAVEITVQPALTKKQSGGKASSKRRSKKGGKEQQQKKKPAPKAKPQQQNAKVNQPKKEQAQKKKGEVAKGKKGKK